MAKKISKNNLKTLRNKIDIIETELILGNMYEKTLSFNEIENLFNVSSHMIVNKSSMKLKHDDVWCIINELENIIQAKK